MITESDIKKVAALSRLGVTSQEITSSTKNVANILQHFSAIQAIDTKSVPATDSASGLTNVARPDQASSDLCTPAELIAAVPETKDGQIKVSAVFED